MLKHKVFIETLLLQILLHKKCLVIILSEAGDFNVQLFTIYSRRDSFNFQNSISRAFVYQNIVTKSLGQLRAVPKDSCSERFCSSQWPNFYRIWFSQKIWRPLLLKLLLLLLILPSSCKFSNLELFRKTTSSNFVSKTFASFLGMRSCYFLKIVHSPIREKLI